MKRNVSIITLLVVQILNASGINVQLGQTDIDTILSGCSIVLGVVGTIHDAWRRWQAKKAAPAPIKPA
jgi:hypothetical protein